jgi:hypothetical protein
MPAPIQLNIPEPCHENWNQMTPQEQGRFCGSCKKVVVDFSVMSDQEILNYFSKAGEHTCGRFSNDQLNKEIRPTEKKKRFNLVYVWSVMLASLLVTKTYAQGKPVKKPVREKVYKDVKVGEIVVLPDEAAAVVIPARMNGIVLDAQNNNPVTGASIMVEGTEHGTMADSAGHFSFSVEKNDPLKIMISAIGYETQTLVLEKTTNWKNIKVLLKPEFNALQEVSVIGYGTTKGRVMRTGAVRMVKTTKLDTVKRCINDWTPAFMKKDVQVYPNPVVRGNSIQVKLALPQTGDYKLELLNTAGQVMLMQPLFMQTKEQQVDLYTQPHWSAGIYWVRISSATTKNVFQSKVLLK